MDDRMKKPLPKAIEVGQASQKKYVRQEGLRPEDIPSPEVVEQMRRQRRDQEMDRALERAAKTAPTTKTEMGKMFSKGGKVGSASRRADGIAQRGKTKGRII